MAEVGCLSGGSARRAVGGGGESGRPAVYLGAVHVAKGVFLRTCRLLYARAKGGCVILLCARGFPMLKTRLSQILRCVVMGEWRRARGEKTHACGSVPSGIWTCSDSSAE